MQVKIVTVACGIVAKRGGDLSGTYARLAKPGQRHQGGWATGSTRAQRKAGGARRTLAVHPLCRRGGTHASKRHGIAGKELDHHGPRVRRGASGIDEKCVVPCSCRQEVRAGADGSRGLGKAIFQRFAALCGARGFAEGSEHAGAYLAAYAHAVRWASASRALIAERLLECLGAEGTPILDLPHNVVEMTPVGLLHCKGAAPADRGLSPLLGSRGTPCIRPPRHRRTAWPPCRMARGARCRVPTRTTGRSAG